MTSHQKVTGLIPVWGSEIIFLRIELDDHSFIISIQFMELCSVFKKYVIGITVSPSAACYKSDL